MNVLTPFIRPDDGRRAFRHRRRQYIYVSNLKRVKLKSEYTRIRITYRIQTDVSGILFSPLQGRRLDERQAYVPVHLWIFTIDTILNCHRTNEQSTRRRHGAYERKNKTKKN